MRILMISPQPFFESRGAPFCVYQHIKALLTLGYEVDLVTYHLGKNVNLPGLRIFRAPRLPFIHSVKPGPSLAKIPLDAAVFFTAFWRLCVGRYRYLHTHEEGAFLGVLLSAVFGCEHLYYMHCDLPDLVASSFKNNKSLKVRLLVSIINFVQKLMVRGAKAVITFYPELEATARQIAPTKPIYMILPPAVDEGVPLATEKDAEDVRRELKLGEGPTLVYTGTLEKYQGLDVLLQSVQAVCKVYPKAQYVIVGGKPEQVEELRRYAQQLGIAEHVIFVGQRPTEEMSRYMAIADVLVSPRSKGTHTPLKLYTYLRSGKPILATAIVSHTQILTSDIALLVSPTPEGLAQGTLTLLSERELARKLGENARQTYEKQYSWSVFLEKNRQAYHEFSPLAH
jgi:glycosyltransferase involved in cell wall biosynthesis